MGIKCCFGCVAPKRHPGCHASCPEYIEEKAINDAMRDEDYKRRYIQRGLSEEKYNAIRRAAKGKRSQGGKKSE